MELKNAIDIRLSAFFMETIVHENIKKITVWMIQMSVLV